MGRDPPRVRSLSGRRGRRGACLASHTLPACAEMSVTSCGGRLAQERACGRREKSSHKEGGREEEGGRQEGRRREEGGRKRDHFFNDP